MADQITEVHDGDGGQRLAFLRTPVAEVLSLTISGLEIPACDGLFGGYTFTQTELRLQGYVFARRAQNVIVSYRTGEERGQ